MPKVPLSDRENLPETRPRHVEAIAARFLRRSAGEDFLARLDRLHRIDRPVRIVKHEAVVMGQIGEMINRWIPEEIGNGLGLGFLTQNRATRRRENPA